MKNEKYRSEISGYSEGANINNIRNEHINKITIPIPPIDTQRRIAAILDKAQSLIAARREQIAVLDKLIKSQFVEMFGDPVTNPMSWEEKRLGDIVAVKSSKRVYQREQTMDGVPFLRVSDLVNKIIQGVNTCDLYISEELYENFLKSELVPKTGDILVTSRGTLGLCYIVKKSDRFYFQDGMISWLDKNEQYVNSVYLDYLFQSDGIKQQIKQMSAGSTVNYLSLVNLGNFKILLPPLDLQTRFADFVRQGDKLKFVLNTTFPTR